MSPRTFIASAALVCLFGTSCEKQININEKAEQEIRQTVDTYTKAFNSHDSDAVMEFWADDSTYVNPEAGVKIAGKEEIKKLFDDAFSDHPGDQMSIQIDSIVFPRPDKAVESGTVTITNTDGDLSKQAYRVFYVKREGKWLIQQAREVDIDLTPDENENLKELSWLIGTWVDADADDDSVTAIETKWDKYKNFIIQKFTVTVEGFLELEGKQFIAWDPVKKQIRSWVFDSDGSFGEGYWSKEGNNWIAEMAQTMSDGKKGSATYIYSPVDEKNYTWQATEREIGGDILPDIETVTVKKKAE